MHVCGVAGVTFHLALLRGLFLISFHLAQLQKATCSAAQASFGALKRFPKDPMHSS